LGIKYLLNESLKNKNKPDHLNNIIDIFTEFTSLKQKEIAAKKQLFRAESITNELEIQNTKLNEKNKVLKSLIHELKEQKMLLEKEFDDQDKYLSTVKNDYILLDNER
jgi:hypothetical protein